MDRYLLEQTLKSYIREDGRSQAAVARKLGYTPDTFNKWVRGVNRIPDRVIAELCDLLMLPPEEQVQLLKLAGYTVPQPLRANERAATPVVNEPMAGVVFATQIMPDGRALDPGTSFAADIADLYAVFRPDSTIPGTLVNVEEPDPTAYYAYLKINEAPTIARLGWRWYFRGKVINDFEMDVTPGNIVWLQRFSYDDGGIFCAESLGPGTYRIVLLLGGNPAISTEISITPAATR